MIVKNKSVKKIYTKAVLRARASAARASISFIRTSRQLVKWLATLTLSQEVPGSSRGNSLLQKCKVRLRTIDPK